MRISVFAIVVALAAIPVSAPQARERAQHRAVAGSADLVVRVVETTMPTINPSNLGSASVANNGESRTVDALNFTVGVAISNTGPDDAAGLVYGLQLPAGLHWQPGQTDPDCTFSPSTADCRTSQTLPVGTTGVGFWHVTADAAGAYVISVHATSATPDPIPADNLASATAVVQLRALAGAAKVVPNRPHAGSVVRVRVGGITVGGEAVAPTASSCSGTVGGRRLKGAARATLGQVTCAYRTPRSAKGKRLGGTVSFTVDGRKIQRRFAVKLR